MSRRSIACNSDRERRSACEWSEQPLGVGGARQFEFGGEDIIARASKAMYAAKRGGRNRVVALPPRSGRHSDLREGVLGERIPDVQAQDRRSPPRWPNASPTVSPNSSPREWSGVVWMGRRPWYCWILLMAVRVETCLVVRSLVPRQDPCGPIRSGVQPRGGTRGGSVVMSQDIVNTCLTTSSTRGVCSSSFVRRVAAGCCPQQPLTVPFQRSTSSAAVGGGASDISCALTAPAPAPFSSRGRCG